MSQCQIISFFLVLGVLGSFARAGDAITLVEDRRTPTYLLDVTEEDIAQSRQHMERVVSRAGTPEQQARARILMLAFEYYEASVLAYRGQRLPTAASPRTAADALMMLDESQRTLLAQQRRLEILLKAFPKVGALQHSLDFTRRPIELCQERERCLALSQGRADKLHAYLFHGAD